MGRRSATATPSGSFSGSTAYLLGATANTYAHAALAQPRLPRLEHEHPPAHGLPREDQVTAHLREEAAAAVALEQPLPLPVQHVVPRVEPHPLGNLSNQEIHLLRGIHFLHGSDGTRRYGTPDVTGRRSRGAP